MSSGRRPWIRQQQQQRPNRQNPLPLETPKVERPKRKRMSTEARVIYELHRHGIYR
jgi:hypothetical protein